MSDFDSSRVVSTGVSFASILAAEAELRNKEGGGLTASSQKIAEVVVTKATDYAAATADMEKHNATLNNKEDLLIKALSERVTEKVLTKCKVYGYRGNVTETAATALYCTLVKFYDSATGQVVVKDQDGKPLTSFSGFNKYAPHIGKHEKMEDDAQISSSTVIDNRYLNKKVKTEWPELFEVFKSVKEIVGECFHIITSHVLFSKNHVVCFEYHQDTDDHAQKSDLSVIINLSKSKSSFKIAGADELHFEKAGDLYLFQSDLWHRSGSACEDTIKIAFFFKYQKVEDVASSSAVSNVQDVVKVEIEAKDGPPSKKSKSGEE